jgi:hypothetical protein
VAAKRSRRFSAKLQQERSSLRNAPEARATRAEIPTQISFDGKRDGFACAIYWKTRADIVRSSSRALRIADRSVISIFRHCACRHSDFPHNKDRARSHARRNARRWCSMHAMKPLSFGTDRASMNLINKT